MTALFVEFLTWRFLQKRLCQENANEKQQYLGKCNLHFVIMRSKGKGYDQKGQMEWLEK